MATGQRALYETEGEFEDELEFEDEGEEFLGTIARGVGGLLGIGQSEFEDEYEAEDEGEYEEELEFEDEESPGAVARGSGVGQAELEFEDEAEDFARIGRWVRRRAPLLRQIARVAAPLVGTAVGGPLGTALGRGAAQLLREGELEGEFEDEYEGEFEEELEFEDEYEQLRTPRPAQAQGELMTAVAARAASEAEAEAMIGAATLSVLSPRERRQLQRVLANLVRGSAILVRILRRRPATRPAVGVVPTVVRGTAYTLLRQAASGRPLTPQRAARVMARQTSRVLGQPRVTQRALTTHVRGTALAARRVGPIVRSTAMPRGTTYRRSVGTSAGAAMPRRLPPRRTGTRQPAGRNPQFRTAAGRF